MKTHSGSKGIQASSNEQQENVKNSRKTFKILQEAAHDKENLVGRSIIDKNIKLAGENENSDIKQKVLLHKAIQTGEVCVTANDLTSDEEPSVDYWRALAETRGKNLDESFHKIEQLEEQVGALKEENRICKEMLNESKNLIEVLQEIVGEESSELQQTTESNDAKAHQSTESSSEAV